MSEVQGQNLSQSGSGNYSATNTYNSYDAYGREIASLQQYSDADLSSQPLPVTYFAYGADGSCATSPAVCPPWRRK